MFSTELAYTLEAAFREAARRRHAYFCLEHLLFALLFDEKVGEIIRSCGGDPEVLKKELEDYIDSRIEKSPAQEGATEEEFSGPVQTPAVQRVMRQALLHAHSAGKKLINAADLLIALYSEKDSPGVFFLARQGVERLDVLNFIAHGIAKVPLDSRPVLRREHLPEGLEEDEEEYEEDEPRPLRGKVLDRFTENLTEQARRGELDPVIGRSEEVERALKVLSRRQKNNPLFLGDSGVGKTALAAAIAQRIVAGKIPETLKGAELFSLNIGSVLAGTKFRGEFEERIKLIIGELGERRNAILFVDEIHTVVGAGATNTGTMDAANLLKPALAAGKLRCIGSTTHEDYKKSFERDRALSRRFSVIDIREPSVAETIEILKGLRERFEEHHGVKYSEGAIKAAAELAARFINDRFLPDKAIDVIDEAGAANSLLPRQRRKKTIGESDVEKVVSTIARVPVTSVSSSDEAVLKGLEDRLRARVFGQDRAVAAVAQAMKRSRAGLKQEGRPVGCFLFAGPTGVGKTELAKVLSQELGVQFHRFDMSEYMEKHSVARLIGAPPGYVGYEEGGILTDLVRKHPYAVLLLDEIEKAHQDIFDILLQIMDDATLTDSHGKRADFRNVILIMTTNAGSEKAAAIGFGQTQAEGNREEAIKRIFRPEFRNRLDETVYFASLSPVIIEKIVEKFVRELEGQLHSRSITFELSAEARAWLAEKGFDPQFGARPMARLIQNELKNPLTEEILFGRLRKGGRVSVSLKSGALTFSF